MKEVGNVEAIVNAINKNKDGSFFFVPWIGKKYEQGLFGKKVLVVGASHYCNHTNICVCPHDNSDCKYRLGELCQKGCNNFNLCTKGKTKTFDDKCKWMRDENEHSFLYENLCNLINKSHHDIIYRLSSNTLDEVCNFLAPNCYDNNSFSRFTDYCIKYFGMKNRYDLWECIAFVNYAQNFQPSSCGNKFEDGDFDAFKRYIKVINPNVVILWGCDLMHELEKRLDVTKSFDGYIWKLDTGFYLDEKEYLNSYHPSYGRFTDGGHLDEAMDVIFKGKGNNEKDEKK